MVASLSLSHRSPSSLGLLLEEGKMAAEPLASALISLIGRDRVLDDPAAREAYSRDATPLFKGLPEVIVTPHSTEEVAEVVKFARRTKTPIIARGAGK